MSVSEHQAADPETPPAPALDVAVSGMHCAACAKSVARALEGVAGTKAADVSGAPAAACETSAGGIRAQPARVEATATSVSEERRTRR